MGTEVPLVAAESTSPSFSTTLSPGDRRLLALAFFFSSLDGDPDLPGDTVVFDDPASGLDKRRKTSVVDAVMGFVGRAQVIVLSHDAEFIRMLRDRGFDQRAAASSFRRVLRLRGLRHRRGLRGGLRPTALRSSRASPMAPRLIARRIAGRYA